MAIMRVLFVVSTMAVLAGSAAADAPVVTKAGKDPKPLRFAVKQGEHHTMTVDITNARQQKTLKGQLLPVEKQPGMHTVMDYAVAAIGADGGARLDLVYRKLEMTDVPDPTANGSLTGFSGTKGHFTVSAAGEVGDVVFDMPASATAEQRAAIEASKQSIPQLAERLPDAPVGIGGVWETRSTVHAGELDVTTVTTHELVKLAGNLATVKLLQKIDGKNTSGTGSLTLHGKSTGETTIDLASVMPAVGHLELVQDIDLVDGKMHLAQRVTMKLAIKRD
jgi:hypothetical protein